jgi:hypothetical protein
VITVSYERERALRWAVGLLVVCGLWWYAERYRPSAAALAERAHVVAEREGRVRGAKSAAVLHGPAGLDSLLERFRADSLVLSTRIPHAGDAAVLSAEVKDALARAERTTGVRITATEPLPVTTEGRFQAAGYTVRVVGGYEGLGVLLTEMASLPRLTRTRGFRLHAIPDSLVRSAEAYGNAGAAAAPPADSAGAAAVLADAGETPFKASAMFDLIWYTLPEGAATDSAAAGSSFAPGAEP